jgi:hypothetical protein
MNPKGVCCTDGSRLHRSSKNGVSGDGVSPRRYPLTRLARSDSLTDADAQVARAPRRLPANRWALDPQAALVALIGHPVCVFCVQSRNAGRAGVRASRAFRVERSADGARLRLGVAMRNVDVLRSVTYCSLGVGWPWFYQRQYIAKALRLRQPATTASTTFSMVSTTAYRSKWIKCGLPTIRKDTRTSDSARSFGV